MGSCFAQVTDRIRLRFNLENVGEALLVMPGATYSIVTWNNRFIRVHNSRIIDTINEPKSDLEQPLYVCESIHLKTNKTCTLEKGHKGQHKLIDSVNGWTLDMWEDD